MNARILLVKEKLKEISAIEEMVKESGFEVLFASDDSTGLAESFREEPNLILCHYSQMGFYIETKGTHLPIILINDANERTIQSASSSHKIAYLQTPFSKDILNTLIDLLLSTED
ncbi:hypothetical protein [Runella aurantiaca]|uniref:hypothetical protein n=1 Tax=Runella aurantiaca TaxID=2282308 RepID=UPI0011C06478|nr:hypothetical protein [Runella aurantiaca]